MALFRSIPVADTVFRLERLPAALAAYPRDSVTLGWQERLRSRARWETDGGVEFGTSLPAGTILRDGDCLALERPPLVVAIHERPEAVLVATPDSPEQAALWAYYIGNSHQPLMLAGGLLVCPDVQGMGEVLAYHGIPFTRDTRPFTPVAQGPSHHG